MKAYIMTFPDAAAASAAVADNPDAYMPGTLIFATAETTMHIVTQAGTLSAAIALVV